MKGTIALIFMGLSVLVALAGTFCYYLLYIDPRGHTGHGNDMAAGVFVMFVLFPLSILSVAAAMIFFRERLPIILSLVSLAPIFLIFIKSWTGAKPPSMPVSPEEKAVLEKAGRDHNAADYQYLVGKEEAELLQILPEFTSTYNTEFLERGGPSGRKGVIYRYKGMDVYCGGNKKVIQVKSAAEFEPYGKW